MVYSRADHNPSGMPWKLGNRGEPGHKLASRRTNPLVVHDGETALGMRCMVTRACRMPERKSALQSPNFLRSLEIRWIVEQCLPS